MKQPDKHVLRCIVDLRTDQRFDRFLKWLRDSEQEELKTISGKRGDDLLEAAVRAGELQKILKEVDSAPETLAKGMAGSAKRVQNQAARD